MVGDGMQLFAVGSHHTDIDTLTYSMKTQYMMVYVYLKQIFVKEVNKSGYRKNK